MNMISKFDGPVAPAIRRDQPRSKPVAGRRAALVAVPLALLAASYWMTGKGSAAAAPPPPPSVTVVAPVERSIDQWDDYVGRFVASSSVEVRPRASGQITGVHFRDGDVVKAGQLVFTIDARPYAAALAEARASVASAASDLSLAEADLGRANRLLADDAVSRSDVDRLSARVRAARAALAAADARARARSLDVAFTQVRAPISGRISDRKVDAGNLVSAGDAAGTLLTTINALDPIYFTFDVPESLYLKTARARRTGQGALPAADIRLQDEAAYQWHGRLDFTDNNLAQGSGTIRARAVVANPGNFLTPGMFGNMRLSDGQAVPALLIPDTAIRTDQARRIVLTVARDGTVVAKPVEPGPLVGGLRAIRSGLSSTDRVIVQGVQFAQPGAKVTPHQSRVQLGRPANADGPPNAAPAASQATLAAN